MPGLAPGERLFGAAGELAGGHRQAGRGRGSTGQGVEGVDQPAQPGERCPVKAEGDPGELQVVFLAALGGQAAREVPR